MSIIPGWLSDLFSPAMPPPPLPLAPVVADPSPVPGCDDATWASYEALLKLREGVRYTVYRDSLGNVTGGIGHLLLPSDGLEVGAAIPDATVQRWFTHDGATAMDKAVSLAKVAGITQQAFLPYLASVCYQLGVAWTSKFPNTWLMICKGQYAHAAEALIDTPWAQQTPVRVADFRGALLRLPAKTV